LETRILFKDFFLRDALGQHPENEFYRYACSFDYRLADHDIRVDRYTVKEGFFTTFCHRSPPP
jgi:hypothetical protein